MRNYVQNGFDKLGRLLVRVATNMATLKRTYRFDKAKGRMVESTPAKIRALLPKRRRRRATTANRPVADPNRNRGRAKWPILSDAMGVSPTQVDEMRRLAKERGVNTDFTPDGRAILTGPAHRAAHARAFGFYDRNGGYGDPAPQNR